MTTPHRLIAVAGLAAVVAVSTALAGGSEPTFTVTSSLDGKKVLPHRSHWLGYTDLPPAMVDRVEFLIDGTVRWIERNPPYNYASDDKGRNLGYLITTWLSPGLHRFVVRVFDKTGHSAKDAVSARVVAAPAPPPALTGTWTRANPENGWRIHLWFDRVGVWYANVPNRRGDGFVEQYDVRGHTLNVYGSVVQGVQEIEKGVCKGNGCLHITHDGRPYDISGNICNYSGPFGRYTWSFSGDKLRLKVIHEGCFGRSKMLAGTWTRTR